MCKRKEDEWQLLAQPTPPVGAKAGPGWKATSRARSLPLARLALCSESFLFSVAADENCKDRYYNCNVVVQARLCVYNYYKTACCASCARVANRHAGFLGSR